MLPSALFLELFLSLALVLNGVKKDFLKKSLCTKNLSKNQGLALAGGAHRYSRPSSGDLGRFRPSSRGPGHSREEEKEEDRWGSSALIPAKPHLIPACSQGIGFLLHNNFPQPFQHKLWHCRCFAGHPTGGIYIHEDTQGYPGIPRDAQG